MKTIRLDAVGDLHKVCGLLMSPAEHRGDRIGGDDDACREVACHPEFEATQPALLPHDFADVPDVRRVRQPGHRSAVENVNGIGVQQVHTFTPEDPPERPQRAWEVQHVADQIPPATA